MGRLSCAAPGPSGLARLRAHRGTPLGRSSKASGVVRAPRTGNGSENQRRKFRWLDGVNSHSRSKSERSHQRQTGVKARSCASALSVSISRSALEPSPFRPGTERPAGPRRRCRHGPAAPRRLDSFERLEHRASTRHPEGGNAPDHRRPGPAWRAARPRHRLEPARAESFPRPGAPRGRAGTGRREAGTRIAPTEGRRDPERHRPPSRARDPRARGSPPQRPSRGP